MPGKRTLLLGLTLTAMTANAQLFSYSERGENFEAILSHNRIVVKERYRGASTIYGDLSCPLGPAIKASILRAAGHKLCLNFSPEQCRYTRHQDGAPIHQDQLAARVPRFCIALASKEEAERLVALVNAGPQPEAAATSTADGSAPTSTAQLSSPANPMATRTRRPEHEAHRAQASSANAERLRSRSDAQQVRRAATQKAIPRATLQTTGQSRQRGQTGMNRKNTQPAPVSPQNASGPPAHAGE
jgi:hypothetical protein